MFCLDLSPKKPKGVELTKKAHKESHIEHNMHLILSSDCLPDPPFLIASNRTLRASLMGGRLAGWCLLLPKSCRLWGGSGEAMAPAEGKAGKGGGPE